MTMIEFGLLVLAGIGAGLCGSVVGLASLVSYPALLAAGLGPVAANVTNTVALVGTGAGSALGSRQELQGQGPRLVRLVPMAMLGGALGAALLLLTPAGVFARVVPWLVGLASVLVIVRPRPRFLQALHHGGDSRGLVAGVFLVAIYGGYFGAAAGVLILALLLAASDASLPQSNAVKNVVLATANVVAAGGFVLLGPVVWSAAVPLGVGCVIGGRLGPSVVRRAPGDLLRVLIGVAGVTLAVKLGLDSYR
ncbi:MAG: sulfite exporter TauE/SafE family protein [Actinomycetes bacterium]